MTKYSSLYKDDFPVVEEPIAVYQYIHSHDINHKYFQLLDKLTDLKDEIVSKWLNITTRTYRNYKTKPFVLKDNMKEHIISLLSLYKHGSEVFGSKEHFEKWLETENSLLDHQAPLEFLDTISGIRFIDNRLTGMEYGENV